MYIWILRCEMLRLINLCPKTVMGVLLENYDIRLGEPGMSVLSLIYKM
jgi:hypothetical protein